MANRVRNQRGVVFPSPVVMVSVVAVAMAGIAFVATRDGEPTERQITTTSEHQDASPSPAPAKTPKPKPTTPSIDRSKVYVEVYNNSGVTGLAGTVATRTTAAGWQVVGSDNWYGTIPATTVYYPQRLRKAAQQLALDLGIERTAPAVDPMRLDRLTVILTGALA